MKYNIFFIFMILASSCNSQESKQTVFTYENFDTEFLNYEPIIKNGVSEKEYEWAQFVISQTHQALKNDVTNYNVTHYWNIMSALDAMKEDKSILKIVLKKLAESEGSCTYILNYQDKVSFDETLPELFKKYYLQCESNKVVKVEFNMEKYVSENQLKPKLVRLIQEIDLNDQKYRDTDEETFKLKQPELDKRNAILIDSLYNEHKTYIGKSLVGEKFESAMWSVVQHSNPKIMERYLPVIHKATKEQELGITPLKMLIDRLYGLKYGYQIFGSQSGFGFEMADEKTRNEIKEKYGIE